MGGECYGWCAQPERLQPDEGFSELHTIFAVADRSVVTAVFTLQPNLLRDRLSYGMKVEHRLKYALNQIDEVVVTPQMGNFVAQQRSELVRAQSGECGFGNQDYRRELLHDHGSLGRRAAHQPDGPPDPSFRLSDSKGLHLGVGRPAGGQGVAHDLLTYEILRHAAYRVCSMREALIAGHWRPADHA